ncbi:biotin/lipoyl-containing protein [Parabacteroides sp. Marseille-P3160]|uniref:biotin/lipoyl-containing protein n=1 Tax=Parabacteroides sp. Marseille-P3160 TaxID=1917887 RepID=UPI0009B94125|nr:biotin/lipoyl-containing protein [Parabacteroides sp. Marseille-P3160]
MEEKINGKEWANFPLEDDVYKTLLTKKFKNREVWHKPVVGEILSSLPGTVLTVTAIVGASVKAGDLLLIQEAMKMQNRILAPFDGVVKELDVKEGDKIGKNHLMAKIEPK